MIEVLELLERNPPLQPNWPPYEKRTVTTNSR
jgi:hypothetical protein